MNLADIAASAAKEPSAFVTYWFPIITLCLGSAITWLVSYFTRKATETHELRMAALDRRLQAHQEAYALWDRQFAVLHDTNKGTLNQECYVWWRDNCLYLSEPARSAFRAGLYDMAEYNDYKNTPEQIPAWNRILKVFEYLETGLGLPYTDRSKDKKGKV